MTLVVCWRSEKQITCVADTKISSGTATVMDSGSKLFIIPIATHVYKDATITDTNYYSYGLAFSGSTLAATNTHALASSCSQLLHSSERRPFPSLRSIVELYAQVADYILRDLNSRKHSDYYLFDCLLFGFCAATQSLKVFRIWPEITSTALDIKTAEIELKIGEAIAIGGGAPAFNLAMRAVKRLGPLEVFMRLVESGALPGVGGSPQMTIADSNGVRVRPILRQHDGDKDRVVLTLLGLDLNRIGKIDGFEIGYEAIGVGIEKASGRNALRSKGIDPDAGPVTREVQNWASIEAVVEAAIMLGKKCVIEGVYTLTVPPPVSGSWYFVDCCTTCGEETAFCHDPSLGKINPFVGSGFLRVKCPHCRQMTDAGPTTFISKEWR
jgi:hypothetical protein